MSCVGTMPCRAISVVYAVAVAIVATVTLAHALDVPVASKKLVILDRLASSGTAKTVYVVKDAAVTKGTGVDPDTIGVTFEVSYSVGSATGAFTVPTGAANGWAVNTMAVAKYVNRQAPSGPTQVKATVLKPGKLLKLVAKGLGDVPLDLVGAGAPVTSPVSLDQIRTRYCVDNGVEQFCFTSRFAGCLYKTIAGGAGAKLVCKDSPLPVVCCENLNFFSFTCGMTHGDCAALGGTAGAVGSVCDATGSCVAPPGIPGDCCEVPISQDCGFASLASDCLGAIIPGTVCNQLGRCQ